MHKKFLLIAFLMLTFSGFGFIRLGRAKKIARCELLFENGGVYPGTELQFSILTMLKDSTQIFSTTPGLTINFADYDLTLKGPISIVAKTRKKLTVKISDEAYKNPEITLVIELRKRPEIRYELRLPVEYDYIQEVVYKGVNGYDPRTNSNNGYKKVHLFANVNLEYIDNEQTLSNNSDPRIIGGKGPDMEVYVQTAPENEQYIMVEIQVENGEKHVKYLRKGMGSLEIMTVGGIGGISKYGGRGGDGGNVTIHVRPKDKPFLEQIFILNYGGEGGELWRPKVDGQQSGPYGEDGELTILDWK